LGNLYETTIVCCNRKTPNTQSARIKTLPLHAKYITILTGDFQTIDIQGYNTFLTKWIQNLDDLLHWTDVVSMKNIDVAPINQRFTMKPNCTGAILDNTYHIQNVKWNIPRNSKGDKQYILRYIAKNLTFNYKKDELQFLMKYFETLSEEEWIHWKPLLYQLIDINFFRDSYRAEAAIQTESVFITIDRLAYIYYDIQATKKQSMCMFGDTNKLSLYIQ